MGQGYETMCPLGKQLSFLLDHCRYNPLGDFEITSTQNTDIIETLCKGKLNFYKNSTSGLKE